MTEALGLEGFSTWYDQRLVPASEWDKDIERAIEDANVVVTLWTPDAVKSRWVRTEADYAFKHSKLLPVITLPCEMPLAYRLVHAFDLSASSAAPAKHPNWRTFIQRLRELIAANDAATREEKRLAEIRRQREARKAQFAKRLRQIGLVALLAVAAGGAYYFIADPAEARLTGVVSSEGSAIALGGIRADRVARLPRQVSPLGGGTIEEAPMAFSAAGDML